MGRRVSLFVTCVVDQLFPQVGMAMADVLERAGCQVDFPENQTCCGQPAFNSGYRSEARTVARVVCVQNRYNLAHREDDPLLDQCAADGIAFVPFFPLRGFSPAQAATLDEVAARLGASAQQVALAWLLHRSPNILLIPGTSSEAHLRENVNAANLSLPVHARAALHATGGLT